MSGKPTYIEVRFYGKGAHGFDLVDNGSGYTQNELAIICKCLPRRERNEIYKQKSLGYRGEALNSLCKSSKVVITTKHVDEPTGLRVVFSTTGEIQSLEPVDMASPGTLVEVRDCFMNNESYKRKFCQNIRTQFDHCMHILTSYSLILTNTVFHVTNGFSTRSPAMTMVPP